MAAVYVKGRIIPLGTLGGSFSYALGLNNRHSIVGYSYLPGNSTIRATAFSRHGPPLDLGTLGGSISIATGVNNSGTIVGAANLPGDTRTFRAVRFTSGGVVDLGTLGGSNSAANAVNDVGQAVGSALGALIDLGTLGGVSSASGVNDSGIAVGYSIMPLGVPLNAPHATVFMTWAGPIDLGGAPSAAFGINRAGDIVGFTTVGGQPHGALWVNAGGSWSLTDINTLIDPSSGWTIDFAWAINDRETIEATGHKSDVKEHTFLLVRCAQQRPDSAREEDGEPDDARTD